MNSPRPAPSSYDRTLSRRGVLTAAGALGLGGLLTACGDGDGDSDDEAKGSAATGGAWSFKDDRGTTAKADGTPKRLVAYIGAAAALHDLGIECTGVFGPTKLDNGEPDPRAGGVDVDKVTILGNTYPEFNVERYAALRPDLLIAQMTEPPALWYVPEESAEKIESLAPSVGILTTKNSLTQVIGRFTELAASLGADVRADKVTAAKERFETASKRLRRATRSRGGLKVMAVVGSADILYVAAPDAFTDLRYYRSLGVEFVTPTKTGQGGFWQELSWENADTYEADLILVDNRAGNLQPAELKKTKPTWARLPAVRAERTFPWANEERFSHAGYAPRLEQLAAAVEGAEVVTE
ncbi:ABC transporter substrate-binding protein [Streptomyces sp. HC44]|uniref:ABC transporter substrate-binding protein n=1 Tax=Streptomyces scabichelini TaxID=2711217 RepID=A0A6G4V913_9ACTN|nr:ABC transporter substrate-binding protein [Streptomyces scabichelini]NGO10304.1 ABC transporter substrate-binding protein [Streptomyces scabichelini]